MEVKDNRSFGLSSGVEQEYPDNNPKTKYGMTKPRLSLVPAPLVLYAAMAFQDGAVKYGPYNWREKKVSTSVYIDACKRHIDQFFDGEDLDPVSGVHHLGHAVACLGVIIDAMTVNNLNDDRPPEAPTAELIRQFTKG